MDGTLFNSNGTTTSSLNILDNVLLVGTYNALGSTDHFNGVIDSMGVWSRLLTQDEIAGLYYGNNNLD